jgi:hypothetical protein
LSGVKGVRSGSRGGGRVHEGLPPGDGRRGITQRRGGHPSALPSLFQQRGSFTKAPASTESTVAVGDGNLSYQQVDPLSQLKIGL